MSFFGFFRRLVGEAPPAAGLQPGSARLAKERLSLILQHSSTNKALVNDFMMVEMHKDIFAVIQKYIPVDITDVNISVKKESGVDIFEMQVALPAGREGASVNITLKPKAESSEGAAAGSAASTPPPASA